MRGRRKVLPRLERGRTFRVVEPTGARVFLRWKARLERDVRWVNPDDSRAPWHRLVVWPDSHAQHRWRYCFTRVGAERALDRALRRRERKRALRAARSEVPA